MPTFKEIEEEFGKVENIENIIKSYNISPQKLVSVIKKEDNKKIENLVWGLNFTSNVLINTRIETIKEKQYFQNLLTTNRCIIPASGYYEWQEISGKKNPYYFKKEKNLLGIAGIINDKNHFSILTKSAEKEYEKIHKRMPIIIKKENYENFFNINKKEELFNILEDNFKDLKFHLVNKDVNDPKNSNENLIKQTQKTLF